MSFPYSGLQPGQRIALFGRAGVGKSYWSKWAVLRSRAMRWVVLDTKHDDPVWGDWFILDHLPSARELKEAWKLNANVVVRPTPSENSEEILDLWLEMLHERFEHFGIVIDETYQVAYGHKGGIGFTGLVTRGRVRGQTVIMGSQRPAWVPKFVFTEAIGFCIMSLSIREDRMRVASMVGDRWRPLVLEPIRAQDWLWYDVNRDKMTAMDPVTILPVPVFVDEQGKAA